MKTPLRAAAAAAAFLSLALLAGCGGSGSASTGGATDGSDGSGGSAAGTWTKQGLPDALVAPGAVPGVSGYAQGGKPRTSMQPSQSVAANPTKCKAQLAAYRKTDAVNPTAVASYVGKGSAPVFNLAVTGWPNAAKAKANSAAATKLEKCSSPSQQVVTSKQGGVRITRFLPSGQDANNWTAARLSAASAQGSLLCFTAPAQHKLCDQALTAAAKKLAATNPH